MRFMPARDSSTCRLSEAGQRPLSGDANSSDAASGSRFTVPRWQVSLVALAVGAASLALASDGRIIRGSIARLQRGARKGPIRRAVELEHQARPKHSL